MGCPGPSFFFALVHKDAGSAFGVTFPDLPGCFSAADRIEDVLPNAREAVALWFDGRDFVRPRPLRELEGVIGDELKAGAFIMAVPV